MKFAKAYKTVDTSVLKTEDGGTVNRLLHRQGPGRFTGLIDYLLLNPDGKFVSIQAKCEFTPESADYMISRCAAVVKTFKFQ